MLMKSYCLYALFIERQEFLNRYSEVILLTGEYLGQRLKTLVVLMLVLVDYLFQLVDHLLAFIQMSFI